MYNYWKQIPDHPAYEISKIGRVRNIKTKRIIRPWIDKGYVRHNLRNVNGEIKKVSAHRLVFSTFVGAIPDGMVIDHIDRVRDNNKLENLRVCYPSANNQNRLLNELNISSIEMIIDLYKLGNTPTKIRELIKKDPK